MLRLAADDRRAGLASYSQSALVAAAAPSRCPTPHPSTCLAGAASTCSTSSWSTSRSRSRSATSPTSPSWALTSSGCRWITAAGPTARIPKKLKEPILKEIDQAVEFGTQARHARPDQLPPGAGVHRRQAGGAEVALDRSGDPGGLRHHWATFAARYQGMPNNLVSFNPLNEPDDKVKPEDHRAVIERVAGAIRAERSRSG